MLLYPFEEQLHLPATPVKLGDGQCWQGKVVGQKYQRLPGLRIFEADSPQRRLVVLERIETGEPNGLIADQPCRPIHGMRVTSLDPQIRLAPRDEEAAGSVESIEPLEVEKPAIHDVKGPRFRQQVIEDVDLVHFSVADMDKTGNVAPQVEQRMQFDRSLGRAKRRPRKHRQTQIYRGGVECINRLVQIDAKGFVRVKLPGDSNQALREVGIDSPVSRCIGVGQSVARYNGPNPEVVKLVALRSKASLDVPQALPIGQLSEGHTEKLIETRERLDLVFPIVPGNASTKRRQWKMLRQLCENQSSLVHSATPRSQSSERDRTGDCSSNRDQIKSSFNHYYSISYGASPAKRWDTTESEYIWISIVQLQNELCHTTPTQRSS